MHKSTLLAAAAFVAATPVSAAQLIVNGGFEAPEVDNSCCTTTPPTPIPGWTVTGGDVNVVTGTFGSSNGNLAFAGDQYLDLIGQQPLGAIEQTFATLAGRTYTVSFAYSHNLFGGSPSASALFSVDGLAGSLTHVGGSTSNLAWSIFTGSFVADGTSATLAFTNTAGGPNAGLLLDAVSVMGAVPEPSAWALLILGFGLVGGTMRRRSGMALSAA